MTTIGSGPFHVVGTSVACSVTGAAGSPISYRFQYASDAQICARKCAARGATGVAVFMRRSDKASIRLPV